MTHKDRREKHTSFSLMVEEALRNADDFLTAGIVRERTGLSVKRVSAALVHLRHYKAVDAIAVDQELWWFATPETDTRLRVHEALAVEEPGSRRTRRRTMDKAPQAASDLPAPSRTERKLAESIRLTREANEIAARLRARKEK